MVYVLRYIKEVRKRGGRKGNRVIRYYRRAGQYWGTLPGEPLSDEFMDAYTRLHKLAERELRGERLPEPEAEEGTLDWLCERFFESPDFTGLSEIGQKNYKTFLKPARRWGGDHKLSQFTIGAVLEFRDSMADRPYMANNVITALRRVFSWGVRRGHMASNPAAKPGRIKAPKRRAVWSPADEKAFLDTAAKTDPMMGLAFMLAAYTAQRQGDILAMMWHQFSWAPESVGAHITLRQAKTGTLVQVPCHADLLAALDSAPRKGITILTNDWGGRFTAVYFRNRWRAVTLAAGLDGLQHRDLRRTAMVRMSEAGCTTQQIAAVSGHEIATTTRILDTYIPRTAKMAEAAILKWEGRKGNKSGNDTAS